MDLFELKSLSNAGVLKLEITADDLKKVMKDVARETAITFLAKMEEERTPQFIPRKEAMKMLNAKPEFDEKVRFKVNMFTNGKEIPEKQLEYSEWYGNPLQKGLSFHWDPNPNPDGDDDRLTCVFDQSDLKELDPTQGKFVFANRTGDMLILTRVRDKAFDYYSVF